jgi:hypothetical protein
MKKKIILWSALYTIASLCVSLYGTELSYLTELWELEYACAEQLLQNQVMSERTGVGPATEAETANAEENISRELDAAFQHRKIQYGLTLCLLFLFLLLDIIAFYFYLKLLWKTVPARFARGTPGKMAGLSLIPLFNFYWYFHALQGLATDLNKALQEIRTLGTTFNRFSPVCLYLMADLQLTYSHPVSGRQCKP